MSNYKFGAEITIPIESANVMDGRVFGVAKRFVIPASGFAYIVFDRTAFTGNNIVFLPAVFKAFVAGPVNIDVFINPTLSASGTIIPVVNRDFTSSKVAQAVFKLNPTVTDDGTLIPSDYVIYSNGTPAIATIGGESSERLPLNLDTTNTYLFKLTNTDATEALAHVATTWFEV